MGNTLIFYLLKKMWVAFALQKLLAFLQQKKKKKAMYSEMP